jgi:hypothetical protein
VGSKEKFLLIWSKKKSLADITYPLLILKIENIINRGYISRRPRSICKEKKTFTDPGKWEKFSSEPQLPKAGPILAVMDTEDVNASVKANPQAETTMAPTITTKK